jgi:prepilin-type N-terminal cleavage/methylation domain-containing protein
MNARRRGFTLMEALATLVVIAVVLPAAMHGLSLATAAAGMTARRLHATALAESKLTELVLTGAWSSGALEGDFQTTASGIVGSAADSRTEYRWWAQTEPWEDLAVTQLRMRVGWEHAGREHHVELVTLVQTTEF